MQEWRLPVYLALARALEARYPHAYGHSVRVAALAVKFGRFLGLEERVLRFLGIGCLLHDIGKVGIPDEVLLKPGPLDGVERALLERHPVLGCDILEPLGLPGEVLAVVRHHHERWDGRGYPIGMAGVEVPLPARVAALADAWDAMRSERPYRPRKGKLEALEEIRANAGGQFDPDLAGAFLRLLAREDGSHMARRPAALLLEAEL